MTNTNFDFNPSISEKDFQFFDLFNLEEIQRLQDLFSDATLVASIITHPDGTPITKPSNFTRLCNDIIRKTEIGCANCFKSDATLGRHNSSGPVIQPCLSGGLWDAGASITVAGKHIANWLIGQVRNEDTDEQHLLMYADKIGADRELFKKALVEIPIMSASQFKKVSEMLFAFANDLSEKAYTNLQLKMQMEERIKTTDLLQESNEYLSIMLHSIGDGVIATDNNGLVVELNPVAEQLCGWKATEAFGKPFKEVFKIINAETRRHVSNPVDKVLETGQIIGLANHTVLISRNGEEYQISDSAAPIKNKEGVVSGVVLVFSDVTKKYQSEIALKESEKNYRDLVENSPDAIAIYVDGVVVFVNNKCLSLMAATSTDELIGKSVIEFVHPDYRQIVIERMKTVMASGDVLPLIEEKFLRLDGTSVDVEAVAIPITFKNKSAVQLIVRDISERKMVQEALKQEKYLMEALMNNLPHHIYFKDKDCRFIRINKSHAKTFGLKMPEEAIGKTDFDFFTEEHARSAYEDENKIIQTGKALIKEEKETWKDRPDSWVSTVKLPLIDNEGRIVGSFGISEDITDRKLAEFELLKAKDKAEESDRLKSAFLANMSHEIRTPMNGILGFADLLKEPNLSGDSQQEYIQVIQKSGIRMLNIINDIIDISKIESGQMEVNISETNVNDQTNYIYTFFKPEVEQKGLQFILKNALPNNEVILKTDREKIYAILTNLVKNAIKFTQKGSIEFGYNLKKDELEFFIKDTGAGIPKDQINLIFERFRQGSESLSKQYEGSGLGLSISKAYIELLGGKIWVESEVGKGTTFYFTIPYDSKLESSTLEYYNSLQEIEKQNKTLKILIVEDDEASSILLDIALNSIAKEVLFAYNGVEAIEKCRNNPDIDLVMMDMKMHQMDGFEATRQIRCFNKEVVIIAQTAYTLTGDKEHVLEVGCNGYISKPIKRDQLLALIKSYFK